MARKRKELTVVVTETAEPMSPEAFHAWVRATARAILEQNGIPTKSDAEILEDEIQSAIDRNVIYTERGGGGFARYKAKDGQGVSLTPWNYSVFLHQAKGLYLVSVNEPDNSTWQALEDCVRTLRDPA